MIMCTNQQTGCQRTIVAKIIPHSDLSSDPHVVQRVHGAARRARGPGAVSAGACTFRGLTQVPTYVEWMKSPVLREQTASEALSIEEEFDMQRRWHLDQDSALTISHPKSLRLLS